MFALQVALPAELYINSKPSSLAYLRLVLHGLNYDDAISAEISEDHDQQSWQIVNVDNKEFEKSLQ
jgi:hypothetical protein